MWDSQLRCAKFFDGLDDDLSEFSLCTLSFTYDFGIWFLIVELLTPKELMILFGFSCRSSKQ